MATLELSPKAVAVRALELKRRGIPTDVIFDALDQSGFFSGGRTDLMTDTLLAVDEFGPAFRSGTIRVASDIANLTRGTIDSVANMSEESAQQFETLKIPDKPTAEDIEAFRGEMSQRLERIDIEKIRGTSKQVGDFSDALREESELVAPPDVSDKSIVNPRNIVRIMGNSLPSMGGIAAANIIAGPLGAVTAAGAIAQSEDFREFHESGIKNDEALGRAIITSIPRSALASLIPAKVANGGVKEIGAFFRNSITEGITEGSERAITELGGGVQDISDVMSILSDKDALGRIADETLAGMVAGGAFDAGPRFVRMVRRVRSDNRAKTEKIKKDAPTLLSKKSSAEKKPKPFEEQDKPDAIPNSMIQPRTITADEDAKFKAALESVPDAEVEVFANSFREEPGEVMPSPRSDLAQPVKGSPSIRASQNVTDNLRNEMDIPGVRSNAVTNAFARKMLTDDYAGTRDRIIRQGFRGGADASVDDAATKMIIRIEGDSAFSELDSDLREQKIRDLMILQNKYRQNRSEIARALQIGGKPADLSEFLTTQIMQGLFDLSKQGSKSIDNASFDNEVKRTNAIIQDLSNQGIDIESVKNLDPSKSGDFVKLARILNEIKAQKASTGDAVYEYWRNSILSAFVTQSRNITGNTLNAAWDFTAQRFADSVVNIVARDPEAASLGEIVPSLSAMIGETARAMKTGILSFQSELSVFDLGVTGHIEPRLEFAASGPAITGAKGRTARWPQRFLLAMDQVAKQAIWTGQMTAIAHRRATAEGLTGTEHASRVKDILANPPEPFSMDSILHADKLVFQQEFGDTLKKISGLRSGDGWGKWLFRFVIPFIQTPANIYKTGLGKTPVTGPVFNRIFGRKITTQEEVAEQLLAGAIGLTLYSWMVPDDESGLPRVTGTTPYQRGDQYRFDTSTIPNQSIRIGDRWVSYAGIEPAATTLSALVDGINFINERDNGRDDAFDRLFLRMRGQVKEKTFLKSIADIERALESPDKAEDWFSNFASSWVPNIIRSTARATDTKVRQFQKDEPFLEKTAQRALPLPEFAGPQLMDWWGRDIDRDKLFDTAGSDFMFRLLSPTQTRTAKNVTNIDRMIMNWNNGNPNDEWFPSPITVKSLETQLNSTKSVMDSGVPIKVEPEQWRQFMKESGQLSLKLALITDFDHENPGKEDIDALKNVFTRSRRHVKEQMWPQIKREKKSIRSRRR